MSATDLKEKVEAIRARHAAATRGPWFWSGYLTSRDVGLHGLGMSSVMEFRRWGMSGAQPYFCTRGILQPLSDLVTPDTAPGRGRVTDVNHHDARFMAAAWQDVADLLARVAELEAALAEKPAGVWQYEVRDDKGGWLADVVLRADGFFSAVSTWDNHAYRWTQPGCPFREFVAQLTPDYVASKLQGRYADGFARKVWPRLVAMVRAELDAEKAVTP